MPGHEFVRRPQQGEEMDEMAAQDAAAAREAQESGVQAGTENGERLKGELDDLLDEIDGVLEVNAEEFVKSYVQKNGE